MLNSSILQNLLKTISESQSRTFLPDADLKLLLSSVSSIRVSTPIESMKSRHQQCFQSQDAKAADSFYASLESVLLELRTVTPVRACPFLRLVLCAIISINM